MSEHDSHEPSALDEERASKDGIREILESGQFPSVRVQRGFDLEKARNTVFPSDRHKINSRYDWEEHKARMEWQEDESNRPTKTRTRKSGRR